MKQLFFITLLASISLSTLNAQSLQIGVGDRDVITGSEMYFFSTPNELEALQLFLRLTNISDHQIKILGLTTPIEVPLGTIYSWCGFGNCWTGYNIPSSEMESGYTEGTNNEFYADVELNDAFDPAIYNMLFWVEDNTSDKVDITVRFVNREHIPGDILSAIGGVAPQSDTIVFISGGYVTATANEVFAHSQKTVRVYPNPAIDYVTFDLGNEKGNVIIRSVSGSVVREITGASGFVSTNVKGLANGIYFYTLERLNGAKVTGKLIVKQ